MQLKTYGYPPMTAWQERRAMVERARRQCRAPQQRRVPWALIGEALSALAMGAVLGTLFVVM